MATSSLAIQLVYAATALLAVVLGTALWFTRDKRGVVPLSVATLGVALWAGAMLGQIPAGEFGYIQLHRLMHLGILVTATGIFVFALEYTGREQYVTRQTVAALGGIAAVAFAGIVLNPGGLFLGELRATETVIGYEYGWAPLFVAYLLYSYVLVAGFAAMLIAFVLRSSRTVYRGQAIALLLGVPFPVALNVLFLTDTTDVDLTPTGFILTGILLAFAIFRYQLGDVTPIAREKVIDNLRDGMLVVDTDDTITDSNPAARRLLGRSKSPIGTSVAETLDSLPELQSAYEEMTESVSESVRTVVYGDQFLEVKATPIENDRGRHVGWTLLLQDVTERERRERDLEGQIEKLDQFASIVSHDLRNPINVASGYIQQAQTTGDLDSLDKSLEAIERMEEIIDDVLTLTREGQDVTEPATVSLETVARETWETVDTGAAELDVVDETKIVADEDQLRRLLGNLFRNSIEHGTETDDGERVTAGHRVTVGTRTEPGNRVTVYVADNGTGIAPEDRDRVFEDGYTTGGTGLGLTIVEQIANAHGWEVSVDESESGGASFQIRGVSRPVSAVIE
jgi:PAS domain S-box-containing protein